MHVSRISLPRRRCKGRVGRVLIRQIIKSGVTRRLIYDWSCPQNIAEGSRIALKSIIFKPCVIGNLVQKVWS